MKTTRNSIAVACAGAVLGAALALGGCADDAVDLGELDVALGMAPEAGDGRGGALTVKQEQVAGLPGCSAFSLAGRTITIFIVLESGGLYAVALTTDSAGCFCVDDREGLLDAGVDAALIPADDVTDGTPLPAGEKPTDGTPLPAGGTGGGTMVSDGTPLPASS